MTARLTDRAIAALNLSRPAPIFDSEVTGLGASRSMHRRKKSSCSIWIEHGTATANHHRPFSGLDYRQGPHATPAG